MREIALYKLQPDYIVGSTNNIDVLSTKISEDGKLLKLIEQDYNYYKQSIDCYKNNNYYSCDVSLFPIIESLHQYISRFDKDEFYRIKNNLEKVSNKISQVVNIYAVKVNYYINLVNQFNDLAENYYFKNNVKRKEELEIINRNRIMHGLFTRVVSKKDCLQLFCTISNLVVIHQIHDHNKIYNNAGKEIDELELKLKLLNE